MAAFDVAGAIRRATTHDVPSGRPLRQRMYGPTRQDPYLADQVEQRIREGDTALLTVLEGVLDEYVRAAEQDRAALAAHVEALGKQVEILTQQVEGLLRQSRGALAWQPGEMQQPEAHA
jgi:hypothetical protein